jgi:AcrR family transcriptional regulator
VSSEPSPPRVDGRVLRRERTRRRIVEATVDLHTTVGPARTTISKIAERAGVQRHTVYAHFPDEAELFRACTGLWSERNPYPDAAEWTAVSDPRERLARALDEVYAWFESCGAELLTVVADAGRVPAMTEQMARNAAQVEAVVEVLARGWGARGRRRARLRAAIAHGLQLTTWRTLMVEGGLSRREAVALLTALADAAAGPRTA